MLEHNNARRRRRPRSSSHNEPIPDPDSQQTHTYIHTQTLEQRVYAKYVKYYAARLAFMRVRTASNRQRGNGAVLQCTLHVGLQHKTPRRPKPQTQTRTRVCVVLCVRVFEPQFTLAERMLLQSLMLCGDAAAASSDETENRKACVWIFALADTYSCKYTLLLALWQNMHKFPTIMRGRVTSTYLSHIYLRLSFRAFRMVF